MKFTLQFLGTGTSVGVPQIGCTCATCTSTDVRDKRRRSSVYIKTDETAFLIDTPPELRLACLDLNIINVQAVVLTHAHMDHIAGFDDVRRFNTLNGKTVMNCYAAPETVAAMHQIFPYISTVPNAQGLYRPLIDFKSVEEPFNIGNVKLTPLPVEHGNARTNGYLLECGGKRLAYISDCIGIPSTTLSLMENLDLLILDCLRDEPHPTHFNREMALQVIDQLKPKCAYLTHISHDIKHQEFEAQLPTGIHLAYDGLCLEDDL